LKKVLKDTFPIEHIYRVWKNPEGQVGLFWRFFTSIQSKSINFVKSVVCCLRGFFLKIFCAIINYLYLNLISRTVKLKEGFFIFRKNAISTFSSGSKIHFIFQKNLLYKSQDSFLPLFFVRV
jgi:hypothetical protein